jgi:isocitrate/isopropylmalate dehydrogenase
VGFPGVPDHVSLWGLLIQIRREFDQYVNLRPVRLLPGIVPPLRDRKPGDIDFWIVRENTEGEYSQIGGGLQIMAKLGVGLLVHPAETVGGREGGFRGLS